MFRTNKRPLVAVAVKLDASTIGAAHTARHTDRFGDNASINISDALVNDDVRIWCNNRKAKLPVVLGALDTYRAFANKEDDTITIVLVSLRPRREIVHVPVLECSVAFAVAAALVNNPGT